MFSGGLDVVGSAGATGVDWSVCGIRGSVFACVVMDATVEFSATGELGG
jgi:hypothetical protein